MEVIKPYHLKTISDYHTFMNLPKPQHPLVSVVRFDDIKRQPGKVRKSIINNFYSVALKKAFNAKLRYGQQGYDFDGGMLAFIAPGQVIKLVLEEYEAFEHTGWLLMFHPDFLWNTSLAKKIKQYDYFGYQINEALHLSEKEQSTLENIIDNINQEYIAPIDRFSQDVIIAHLELLLTYSERFYQRQFITRKIENHTILDRLEVLLTDCFKSDYLSSSGLPTVQYISDKLNISPNYLSRLLKTLTGQSTQQFIHDKLIDFAKERLSSTDLSVQEIAHEMGFEYPQSFSKLFKAKTKLTPVEFRNSFN